MLIIGRSLREERERGVEGVGGGLSLFEEPGGGFCW